MSHTSSRASVPGEPRHPPLRIGRLEIWPPLLQAPMSALTNLPMRTLAEQQGCGLTITEFLPAAGLAAGSQRVLARMTASCNGRPFGAQIYGRDPEQMGRAAAIAAALGAAVVDINMGCPAKKVTRGVCGSALMREPVLAGELVRAAKEAVAGQAEVTVKIRSGWDERDKNAPEFACRMVEAGAVAVTVHGRTREQRFDGVVDLEIIARVKQMVDVPVIANGDIVDELSLARTLALTGADGVMIGRAALCNPWLFAELRAWFESCDPPPPPTPSDRLAMLLRHFELYLELTDGRRAVLEMRKFARWYLEPLPQGETLRRRIYALTDPSAVRDLLLAAMGSAFAHAG